MTWADVTFQIRQMLASQYPENVDIGRDAVAEFERLLRMVMPEVIGHPELILAFDQAVVIDKMETVKCLDASDRDVLDMVFSVLSRPDQALPWQVRDRAHAPKREEHKLKSLACLVSEIFEQLFNCSAPYILEYQPSWLLSVPDPIVYQDVWGDVSAVYESLVDHRWTLTDRLQAYEKDLKRGQQRVDIWFEEPFNCIVEFDETQHFNQYRLRTLQACPGYTHGSLDIDHYMALAGATTLPTGITPFQRLKSFDPLFPPLLDGEAQDNRMRQRAFRDFLKDITPRVMPNVNPTIRISYMMTNGRIRDFAAEDLKGVEEYVTRCGVLERMRLA
jgi:hypothetical protein